MSRRYTEEEKRRALARLRDEGGDFGQASASTGIPARTLRTWARQQRQTADEADAERVMAQLRHHLIENVLRLADSLEAKIDDAPLNQHASALAQLIDRLIKLAEKLPQGEHAGTIRIEYIDLDDTVHSTPPWTRNDSEG